MFAVFSYTFPTQKKMSRYNKSKYCLFIKQRISLECLTFANFER